MKQPPHEITPELGDRTVHIAPRPGADRGKLVTDSLSTGFAIMLALTMAQRLVGFMRQLIVCRILDPEELGREYKGKLFRGQPGEPLKPEEKYITP